jgi:hypothetical protein
MDFDERLRRAVERGRRKNEAAEAEAKAKAMSADETKRLHSKYRLELSDHIEKSVARMIDYFPGFEKEIIFGEQGWGAAVTRDDLTMSSGQRTSARSRFEVCVRPLSDYHVLDVAAKGMIHNKELFQRNHFERVEDAQCDEYIQRIDQWVLEFAELFASKA